MCSCHVNDISAALLVNIITNNHSLTHLDLSKSKLHAMEIIQIAKALQRTVLLKYLILDSINVSNKAAYELSLAIKENFLLKHLSLFECNLQDDGLMHITIALQSITSLQYLDLSDNNIISDAVAINMAVALSCNTELEYLDFYNCGWECYGLQEINKILPKLSNLKQSIF